MAATKYQGHDLIDVRVFARKKGGEIIATRKGVSLNVDQIPDLLECLEWALQQPCEEDPDRAEERCMTATDAERLALETHRVLSQHGLSVHWDTVEAMVLDRPEMMRFTKWDLHYVLTIRRDLFVKDDSGCFRAT